MADMFLVTERNYKGYFTLAEAQIEKARRDALKPGVEHKIIRCKTFVEPSGLYPDLLAFVKRIATCEPVAAALRREAGHLVARHDAKQVPPKKTEAA